MTVRRSDHDVNLNDRELVWCLAAFDYVASEDALDGEASGVWMRLLQEAKRRGLQSPEHRSYVSSWIATQIQSVPDA